MRENKNDIDIENAVLRTLAYFDIFNYPLKTSEIVTFLPLRATYDQVDKVLAALVAERQIARLNEFYSLQFETKLFNRRRNGNALADSLFPAVKKQADLIFKFPFVRAVLASGSFSKNFMEKDSDFDFFIVCAPGRLWISRMLLVIYKKIFLRNSHRHFCVNYFVDELRLEIDEKNIFTATELATVLPLTAPNQYRKLIATNQSWLAEFFPNFKPRALSSSVDEISLLKKAIEKCIDALAGNFLNRWFRNITRKRWKKMYSRLYPQAEFDIAFKSTENVSKNHPRNFQKKVLDEYELRVCALTKKVEAYE